MIENCQNFGSYCVHKGKKKRNILNDGDNKNGNQILCHNSLKANSCAWQRDLRPQQPEHGEHALLPPGTKAYVMKVHLGVLRVQFMMMLMMNETLNFFVDLLRRVILWL